MTDDWPDLAGRIDGSTHRLGLRVYYEDTDFSGVVYHANYLKYCERGRSDFLRLLGIHHRELHDGERASERLGFAVKDMKIDFIAPARIDDVVEVQTRFAGLKGARFLLEQKVTRDGQDLFTAELTAVLLDGEGRPRRLPKDMQALLAPLVE